MVSIWLTMIGVALRPNVCAPKCKTPALRPTR
jgi:hypothetical protein